MVKRQNGLGARFARAELRLHGAILLTVGALAGACMNTPAPSSPDAVPDATPTPPDAAPDTSCAAVADAAPNAPRDEPVRQVVSTRLRFDLSTLQAVADVTLAASEYANATLNIGDLSIVAVTQAGRPVAFLDTGDQVWLRLPPSRTPVELRFKYVVRAQSALAGWSAGAGVSFLWPYYCQNLFPCNPSPSDGLKFGMTVTGVPEGQVAVYAPRIGGEAPSYMPALAVGPYQYRHLGTTPAGTEVGAYSFAHHEADMLEGAIYLPDYFEFYERQYGPYPFGSRVASVEANWGFGIFGGMEHHPYWHVSSVELASREIHAHEAAHGWFGNGVRIACWEDFVLSEGLATYMAARAIESVEGFEAGRTIWAEYQEKLEMTVEIQDTVALPRGAGCGGIDILTHPLWSLIPYLKGAFFLRAVEERVGRDALDAAIALFYQRNVGRSARMRDFVDHLRNETRTDLTALADAWLYGLGIPK